MEYTLRGKARSRVGKVIFINALISKIPGETSICKRLIIINIERIEITSKYLYRLLNDLSFNQIMVMEIINNKR